MNLLYLHTEGSASHFLRVIHDELVGNYYYHGYITNIDLPQIEFLDDIWDVFNP